MSKPEEINKNSQKDNSLGQGGELEALKRKFPDIQEEKLKEIVKIAIKSFSVQEFYSGPLPHPQVFAGYEKVLPGAAERILAMTEKQATHRQFIEKKVITSKSISEVLGVIFAFLIALVTIGGGIFLISIGQNAGGLTSIIVALATLVTVFFTGKKKQNKELEEKRSILPNPK